MYENCNSCYYDTFTELHFIQNVKQGNELSFPTLIKFTLRKCHLCIRVPENLLHECHQEVQSLEEVDPRRSQKMNDRCNPTSTLNCRKYQTLLLDVCQCVTHVAKKEKRGTMTVQPAA